MTVRELIEKLQAFDPESPVVSVHRDQIEDEHFVDPEVGERLLAEIGGVWTEPVMSAEEPQRVVVIS